MPGPPPFLVLAFVVNLTSSVTAPSVVTVARVPNVAVMVAVVALRMDVATLTSAYTISLTKHAPKGLVLPFTLPFSFSKHVLLSGQGGCPDPCPLLSLCQETDGHRAAPSLPFFASKLALASATSDDLEVRHHHHVFVLEVVAVKDILAAVAIEAHGEPYLFVG